MLPFGISSSTVSRKSIDLSKLAFCKSDFSFKAIGSRKCMYEHSLAASDTVSPVRQDYIKLLYTYFMN